MPQHSIRIPKGWGVLDMRGEGTALPQDALRGCIDCTPANWRDVFGRAVYRDGRGHGFCVERMHGGLHPCIYLVQPVETEEDAEQEPFTHTLDEMEAAYA